MRQASMMRPSVVILMAVFLSFLSGATITAMADDNCGSFVGQWTVGAISLSPNGDRLAELVVVTRSSRKTDEIIIRELRGSCEKHVKVYSESGASSVHWLSDNRIAFGVSGQRDALRMIDVRTGRVRDLVETTSPVTVVVPDIAGRQVAYLYVTSITPPWENGSVKVTEDMGVLDVAAPKWVPRNDDEEFHVGVVSWDENATNASGSQWILRGAYYPPELAWYGGRLFVTKTSSSSWLTSVYDVSAQQPLAERSPIIISGALAISRHGLVATTSFGHSPSAWMGMLNVYVRDHLGVVRRVRLTGQPYIYATGIWWRGESELFSQVLTADVPGGAYYWALARVNWRTGRVLRLYKWPGGSLGSPELPCTLDLQRTRGVCVVQSLTKYPRMVEINLETGRMRQLGSTGSDDQDASLQFREVRFINAYGQSSTGFLAVPPRDGGRPVPLAVMLYGFYRVFSRNAQWITSYPVEEMVHAGIAVLLLNFPSNPDGLRGDFAQIRMRFLDGPLATVAAVRPILAQHGVRVSRVMIMGWSQGGLVATHAMQKSREFVAAEVGDPAIWVSGAYGIGSRWWRTSMDAMFGGPPDRRYIGHYLDFDPVADGKPSQGPILFEFASENVPAGQYLEEWRAAGSQVEAFAYHYSLHVLTVPQEAKISRERNLDWAELNLLGPKSVSATELRRVGLTVPINGWWTRRGQAVALSGSMGNGR